MKKKLQYIISRFKVVEYDELKSLLGAKNRVLRKNLEELLKERAILLIEDKFIPGPNIENVKYKDLNLKELNLESLERREVDWEKVSKIIFKELKGEIKELKNDIKLLNQGSKKLELRYFDLSIKYHEFYRFFYMNYKPDFLICLKEELEECRKMLDKLEYDN